MKKQLECTELGKKIKIKLIEMSMTQKRLASDLGITPQYLQKILIGERSGEKYMNQIKKRLNLNDAA